MQNKLYFKYESISYNYSDNVDNDLKAQSALEFLTTYAWAFLIMALFISVVVLLISIKNPQEYSPSACYISPELVCSQSIFYTNSTSSVFAIMVVNNLGATLQFSQTPFMVYSPYFNYSYPGNCLPSTLPKMGTAVCIVKIPKTYPVGSQINPNFKLTYSLCPTGASCTSFLNTSGVASDIIVYSKMPFSNITILTNTGTGNVILNGIPYQNNTKVTLINNLVYNIYAQPPSGYRFNGWSYQNGIIVFGSTAQQSTTLYVQSSGQLIASFK
jgi:hypothetical protein